NAGDVRRQEIRGALKALEGAPDTHGQGPRHHRLGHAGNVLEKDVAFAEVSGQGERQRLPLADDHFLDVADQLAGERRDVGHAGAGRFKVGATDSQLNRGSRQKQRGGSETEAQAKMSSSSLALQSPTQVLN